MEKNIDTNERNYKKMNVEVEFESKKPIINDICYTNERHTFIDFEHVAGKLEKTFDSGVDLISLYSDLCRQGKVIKRTKITYS